VAGARVNSEALGGEEPVAERALVLAAIPAEPDELLMHGRPVRGGTGTAVDVGRTLADEQEGRSRGLVGTGGRVHRVSIAPDIRCPAASG
jgi:hypothetical protein